MVWELRVRLRNSNGGSGGMQSSMHGSRHFPAQEVISPEKKKASLPK
jgi:hypothetical protein